jgi:DNA-binding transcriptional regulator YhcF (GntR family)
MIRLWLSRDTGTPIQEQLSAQFVLGILSRRLTPGEKLPSVRALARQLKLHPNTVSAVYRVLVERGWVKRRPGSGVYVRQLDMDAILNGSAEAFARSCLNEGLARGFSPELLQQAFIKLAHESGMRQLVVMDPDPRLAAILAAEIGDALGHEIPFASDIDAPRILNRIPVCWSPKRHRRIYVCSMRSSTEQSVSTPCRIF